ncbi:LacI family DNA-binding transcriptional regulator [Mahella australiensis]|uniref:Transcriptional regulator, LacI family n=1 Tax=Mahella australiensis (strain DSM 15567 / CIP 107919 / 50-1 BON) TaxID=697281 RepID=F4A267_MAHA5|nr:LacI family DNA-binding transcriptional regulator [Mahella australiensis]AEE97206.1 transcriptional regulator, LacI family [Mahella australiensis 50-1 BON]
MPNIKDIAKAANTSKSTVSRYLNGYTVKPATAKAIAKAIEELGYHPNANAKGLVLNKTNVIGIVLDNITNNFYAGMLAGIESITRKFNYSCVYYSCMSSQKKENEFLNLIYEGRVDGLILGTFSVRDIEDVKELSELKDSIVIIGDNADNKDITSIDIDNEEGIAEMVCYLYSLGHKRIAYLSGPKDINAAIAREKGYIQGLRKCGILYDPNLVIKSDWTFEGGYNAVKEALGKIDFTAIVGSNDYSAYGALRSIQDAGLNVPGDVSVTGFDDIDIAAFSQPPMTTIRQPFFDVGRRAAMELLDKIDNKAQCYSRIILKPTMIKRESCRAII